MLDAVPGGAHAGQADLLGSRADALDHGGHGGVPDGVEPRLEARLGACHHMRADRGGVQVGGAGVVGVGVWLVQTGGVRAQGAIDEEVARGADRAQRPGLFDILFGPVADDPGARFFAGEPQQPGEVVLGGDLRARALVHGADAERGGVGERGTLGLGALGRGDGAERGGAHGVMGVAGQGAVGCVPGSCGDPRNQVQQRGGDHGGVHVDTGEVERAATGRLVEFGARRGRPPGQRAASQP